MSRVNPHNMRDIHNIHNELDDIQFGIHAEKDAYFRVIQCYLFDYNFRWRGGRNKETKTKNTELTFSQNDGVIRVNSESMEISASTLHQINFHNFFEIYKFPDHWDTIETVLNACTSLDAAYGLTPEMLRPPKE